MEQIKSVYLLCALSECKSVTALCSAVRASIATLTWNDLSKISSVIQEYIKMYICFKF